MRLTEFKTQLTERLTEEFNAVKKGNYRNDSGVEFLTYEFKDLGKKLKLRRFSGSVEFEGELVPINHKGAFGMDLRVTYASICGQQPDTDPVGKIVEYLNKVLVK